MNRVPEPGINSRVELSVAFKREFHDSNGLLRCFIDYLGRTSNRMTTDPKFTKSYYMFSIVAQGSGVGKSRLTTEILRQV